MKVDRCSAPGLAEIGHPGLCRNLLIKDIQFVERLDVFGNEADRNHQHIVNTLLSESMITSLVNGSSHFTGPILL